MENISRVFEFPLGSFFLFGPRGTGKSTLRRSSTNLLGGRAAYRSLHPFMACELSEFDLGKALKLGMVPLVLDSPNPEETLTSYANLYLEQEVQAEGLTRNIGAFARFLEVMSFSHGAVLNASAVARECEIERRTVVNYIDILEDLLLGFRIPVFTRRARRKTISHPKFYYFDTGVFRSLRPRGPLDSDAETALIYRGDERRRIDNIWCIPAQEFLSGIQPGQRMRFDT